MINLIQFTYKSSILAEPPRFYRRKLHKNSVQSLPPAPKAEPEQPLLSPRSANDWQTYHRQSRGADFRKSIKGLSLKGCQTDLIETTDN